MLLAVTQSPCKVGQGLRHGAGGCVGGCCGLVARLSRVVDVIRL